MFNTDGILSKSKVILSPKICHLNLTNQNCNFRFQQPHTLEYSDVNPTRKTH